MINLLPPDLQQQYHYARRNTSLLRWLVMFGIGIIGLGVISGAGWIYIRQASSFYASQSVIAQESLAQQKQTEVESQIKDMSSSLKLAVQVLSKEVLFSKLLIQLGVITPSNASLSNLSIDQLAGGMDITARTQDYQSATQLQVNLADPNNKIFSKADITSITCGEAPGSEGQSKYPCTVVIRALFSSNNPFLFINNKTGN